MASVNKVILVGFLGKDPETRQVGSSMVSKFSIATTESYKGKDGNKVENTEWHNIEAWGDLATISEKYLKKGSMVYLEGSIRTDSWEDNGTKKYATKIRATSFTMLGGKPNDQSNDAKAETPKQQTQNVVNQQDTDDLPF
jgi:single-strand DNA-binding protein